jgi:bacterioferritin
MVSVHPRVSGYLGRALSLELSAVQQYMTQACLAEQWGDLEAAGRFRRETVEELQHAERIVQRMLQLGLAPGASQLKPISHAPNLEGLLRLDAVLEVDLIEHYAEAVRFCEAIADSDNRAFFAALWQEESAHGQELQEWLATFATSEALAEPQHASF